MTCAELGVESGQATSGGTASPGHSPDGSARSCLTQNDHREAKRKTTVVAILRPHSLRSSSATLAHVRPARLPEIRFEGLVGLTPPLSCSLPQRTGRVFNCAGHYSRRTAA